MRNSKWARLDLPWVCQKGGASCSHHLLSWSSQPCLYHWLTPLKFQEVWYFFLLDVFHCIARNTLELEIPPVSAYRPAPQNPAPAFHSLFHPCPNPSSLALWIERRLPAPAEDPASTSGVSQPLIILVLGIGCQLLTPLGTCTQWCTFIHTDTCLVKVNFQTPWWYDTACGSQHALQPLTHSGGCAVTRASFSLQGLCTCCSLQGLAEVLDSCQVSAQQQPSWSSLLTAWSLWLPTWVSHPPSLCSLLRTFGRARGIISHLCSI